MEIAKSLKKVLVCGIALVSLASVGAINSSNYVSAKHVRTTRVSHNQVNSIYNKMMNVITFSKHPSKSFEHKFMKTLPKFSSNQLYNLNDVQGSLNKHDKKVFNRIYNHKFNNKVNHHAKFNHKIIYNLFIKDSDGNNLPITKQDQYDFMKILPKLNYKQVANIYKHNDNSKTNVLETFGNKIGNAIVMRYTQMNEARLDKKLSPILAEQNKHMSGFDKEVLNYEFNDVNQVRKAHGLKPLKHSNALQAIANMRASQALKAENEPRMEKYSDELSNGNDKNADDLAHGYSNHETNDDDAHKLGIGNAFNGIGENVSGDGIGVFPIEADNCGDPEYIDYNTTPAKIASNDVRDMVKYDRDSYNGHRHNILNKNAHYLAVSIAHDPNIPDDDVPVTAVQEFY